MKGNEKMTESIKQLLFEIAAICFSFLIIESAGDKDRLKDEDAFFPIKRRKLGEIGKRLHLLPIVRVRAVWSRIIAFVNALVFCTVVIISKKTSGNIDFVLSNKFRYWIIFTAALPLIVKLGFYICIRYKLFKKCERIKLPESPKEENIKELAVSAVPALKKNFPVYNIYVLNAYKPIYCLRSKSGYNRVAYYDDIYSPLMNSVWVHFFSPEGYRKQSYFFALHENVRDKNQFQELRRGTLLPQVQEMDPGGCYEEVWNHRKSFHCTSDGYWIEISYDSENKVQEVSCELL